jgi:hypothetical protein
MEWFGNSPWSPFSDFGERVPIPVGKECVHCGELIGPADSGYYQAEGDYTFHEACFLRGIIGSVGHQNGTCPCHGGTAEDPPGLSRREAALAALLLYTSRERHRLNLN